MPPLKVFFAMHDVTPFHRERLDRAEALFEKWGLEKVLYLLVPNYHGAHRADHDPAFAAWCRRPRNFAVEWFLHGYFHLAVSGDQRVERLEAEADPRHITGALPVGSPRSDESEFSRLASQTIRDRLAHGSAVFRDCLGQNPAGFVAPKWMAGRHVSPVLAELGFRWTESDRSICYLPESRELTSPVITWATRAWWRKQVSLWGCPILATLCRRAGLLRIAMHPFDFDHPAVIDSIARIVAAALEHRAPAFYAELNAGNSAAAAA